MNGASTQVPTLRFTPAAWARLQGFLQLSKEEISGFGQVTPLGSDYLVDEIYLVRQEVSVESTEMAATDIGRFMTELDAVGVPLNELKLWWHSHGSMDLFWSALDDSTIRSLAESAKTFFFGLVGRYDGSVRVRLDIARPVVTLDHIPTAIEVEVSEEVLEACAAEMQAKVTRRKPRAVAMRLPGWWEYLNQIPGVVIEKSDDQ